MPFARIIASNPSAARYTARTLHEAGYEVEIVPPGTAANPAAEVVFDVDADKMLSIDTEIFAPGEREFVLKPLWRRLTANRKAEQDIFRALRAYPRRSAPPHKQKAPAEATPVAATAAANVAEPDIAACQAAEAATFAERQHAAAAEEKRRAEETERLRAEQVARAQEAERIRTEQLRIQQEQEAALQRELEAQRLELHRQQQARELELARRREREEREMIVLKQEEERKRAEAIQREAEVKAAEEAVYQRQLEDQRLEALRREMLQRDADEAHRSDVIRQRHDEEHARKAEAQRLLLEANLRREQSARARETARETSAAPNPTVSVPTLSQYMALRLQHWSEARAARSRSKVTRIDSGTRSAWRQAWPVTAGVAALCLIGWGIASYHEAPSAAASQEKPPILSPGQYAPYPVATPVATPAAKATRRVKRSAVRSQNIAQDEVVVHHYYPSKTTTAQNQGPHKKITDLQ